MNSQLLCWFCLKADCWNSPLPIFMDNFPLPTKIQYLFGIELKRNDSLQQVVCHSCLAKIAFMDEFATQVKSSNNLINSFTPKNNINRPVTANNSAEDVTNSLTAKNNAEMQVPNIETTGIEDEDISSVDLAPIRRSSSAQVNYSIPLKSTVNEPVESTVVPVNKIRRCLKCKFYSKNNEQFENHLKRNYECKLCSARFCSERGVKQHRSRIHKLKRKHSIIKKSNNVKTRVKPTNDINTNSSEEVFDGHERTIPNKSSVDGESDNTNKAYKWCEMCDKVFLSSTDLKKHNEKYHSSLCEEENLNTNVQKKTRGRKKKTIDCKTPDKASNSVTETSKLDKISVVRLNSSDIPTAKSPIDESLPSMKNKIQSDAKRKKISSSLETFHCWKCKKDYQSRGQLFVHKCCPIDEGEDIDNENSDKVDRSREKSLEHENDSKFNNSNESLQETYFVNVNLPKLEINAIERNDAENSNIIMEVLDSDDEVYISKTVDSTDDAKTVDLDPAIINLNDDGMNGKSDTIINVSLGNCHDSTAKNKMFCLKKCNECDEEFTNMKELFLHKRTHRVS